MKDGSDRTSNSTNSIEALGGEPSLPSVSIDLVSYVHHLEGLPLSYEEKLSLLHALNELAWNFIAMGFQIHPVQNACGQNPELPEIQTIPSDDAIDLGDHFFRGTNDDEAARELSLGGERAD